MFKPVIRHLEIKKPAVHLGPVTVPSGRWLDQGQGEMALSPKACLWLRATAPFIPLLVRGGGEEIKRFRQKVVLPAPIPSCSSYLGEGLRWLEEVPIPRIWAINMDQVVGRHVEVVVSE